ncbi:PDZ domain-containing protein [Ureibacillus composti]|nr:PDZ domain-containing protein [Ureibacillus composti]
MNIEIVKEIVLGIGRMFLNPILYVAIFMAIYLGYRRVKRERKYFNIRILWGWSETIGLIKEGLLWSFVISIITIVFGLAMPIDFLYLVSIASLIGLVLYVFHFLSPIVIGAVGLVVFYLMDNQNWSMNLFGIHIQGIDVFGGTVVSIAIVVGLLLVAEGLLIKKSGANFASPIIENTKRGKRAVAFLSKKLWLLPIFLIVPGNSLQAYFPWWPQISLGSNEFSLVLFPVIVGFQQMARNTLPAYLFPKLGRSVMLLGLLVTIGGLVAYFQPIVGLVTVVVGAILRLWISVVYAIRERKAVYAVSAKSNGAMIAAVLPDSPAEKMGLVAGEIIRKVNGVQVHNEHELYEALQINAAHCRLEVLNHENEIRLTQHVVYSDDHYKIGILLADA